jgi:hypothetical protein
LQNIRIQFRVAPLAGGQYGIMQSSSIKFESLGEEPDIEEVLHSGVQHA